MGKAAAGIITIESDLPNIIKKKSCVNISTLYGLIADPPLNHYIQNIQPLMHHGNAVAAELHEGRISYETV